MGYIDDANFKDIGRGQSEGDGNGDGARDAGKILNDNKDIINNALQEIDDNAEKKANKATNLDTPNNTNYPTTQAVANAVGGLQAAWEGHVASELTGFQEVSEKNQPNGYAGLDANTLIPAALLPGFVDDIIEGEYIDTTTFNDDQGNPVTGESGKIYVDTTQPEPKPQYRWSGSQFTYIPQAPGTTDEVAEGTINKYFTGDRVRAVLLTGYETITGFFVTANDTIVAAIGKLQGQINSLSNSIGNKLDKGGYTGTAKTLKDLIDTKQTKLQVETLIAQAESTALDKRMAGLAADLDATEKDAIKTKLGIAGGGSTPPADYANKAALLADQVNQVENEKYTMLNANGWNDPEQDTITHSNWATVKYLGTTNGDESDYDLREQFDVDAANATPTEEDIKGTTITTDVSGSYAIDWGAASVFHLTMTAATTFTFSNLAIRPIEVVLTGDFAPTFPTMVIMPNSDAFDGTKDNRIQIDPVRISPEKIYYENHVTT